MGQTPRLDEVIEEAINDRLENFWTAIPARVKKYDSATQTATIQIVISNKVEDGSGNLRWYKPTIHSVPVMFPGSSGAVHADDYSITFPIRSVSNGLYIVSTLPTDIWRYNGNDVNLKQSKGSTNRLSSGFLIPAQTRGLYREIPNDAMVLSGLSILLGSPTGTSPLATENTLENFMKAIAPGHTESTPGTPLSDPAGVIAILYAALRAANWPYGYTSTRVEAK
jgi:hypothetical protein